MEPLRAMILAAGLGTRLRPLTDELPKPLVPVGDRPALAHVAARLAAAGIREAVINVHHLAAAFTPAILAAMPLVLRVSTSPRCWARRAASPTRPRSWGTATWWCGTATSSPTWT